MDKKIKMLICAGAVLGLLLVAMYLKKKDAYAIQGKTNTIQSVEEVISDKTFKSKTEAYDALANDKETFYNRSASAFKASVVPTPAVQEEKQEQPQMVASIPIQDKEFDAAFKEVEQNVRSIYDKAPESERQYNAQPYREAQQVQQVVPKQQPETAEERRRRAMLADWGINKPEATLDGVLVNSAFRAVIHGTQTIKAGQTALFRTKEAISYNNFVVPANTLLSGVASVTENRLAIKIGSVRLNRDVYALPLEVFGSDGIAGIPLNYDEAGQVADKQVSSTAIQEASSAISQLGGAFGRVAGSVISGVSGQVKNVRNIEVKLIDNQSIILKISKQ